MKKGKDFLSKRWLSVVPFTGMERINEDQVRARVWQFKAEYGIPLIRLGEILGSSSRSVAGRTMYANRFLKTDETSLSITQVNALAQYMQIPVDQLLFGEKEEKEVA